MSQETKNTVSKKVIESYDIANSHETMHLAQDLARFIKENNLFHNIQGKAYVNVEGWQYAGARLGILPVIEELAHVGCDDNEIKYQAKVKLMNIKTQQAIGSGFAICSNKESGKRNYQEFAIASMAQTRAIGKAYRNILAWIIRAAGYEPTPAEEMDYMVDKEDMPATKNGKSQKSKSNGAAGSHRPIENKVVTKTVNEEKKSEKDKEEVEQKLATVKQKTELLLLLNNKVITNEEKNKMIENINKLDIERADKAIEKLKKVIEERQSVESHAA